MSDRRNEIDTLRAHPARMYDYYLGGKDWFPADRAAAEEVLALSENVRTAARANRAFMRRAARALAAAGVRQFLDLGAGIPTAPNLHQVVQEVAPECRVVYVDNDPMVVEYVDALTHGTPEGGTAYVEADAFTEDVLRHPAVTGTFDLSQPVALCFFALLHFAPDEREPYALVRDMCARLPSGSHLALSHITPDFAPEDTRRGEEIYRRGGTPFQARTREEFVRFLDGLDPLEPGVVVADEWRPDLSDEEGRSKREPAQVGSYAAVARKP